MPVDVLHSRQTAQAVRDLVQSAADANMNMIRVWGGGLYYRDEFYDACDAAGLLVWQEAMFACSLYPANQAFLDDVRGPLKPNALSRPPASLTDDLTLCCMLVGLYLPKFGPLSCKPVLLGWS